MERVDFYNLPQLEETKSTFGPTIKMKNLNIMMSLSQKKRKIQKSQS